MNLFHNVWDNNFNEPLEAVCTVHRLSRFQKSVVAFKNVQLRLLKLLLKKYVAYDDSSTSLIELFFIINFKIKITFQVKAVYLAAKNLKMERVANICAQYLIKHLSVENCIEIRSLHGIARNKDFIQQVDTFIAKEVSKTTWW